MATTAKKADHQHSFTAGGIDWERNLIIDFSDGTIHPEESLPYEVAIYKDTTHQQDMLTVIPAASQGGVGVTVVLNEIDSHTQYTAYAFRAGLAAYDQVFEIIEEAAVALFAAKAA